MDFDLSLIDQVEENKDSAPARASKFVPRAIARSRPKIVPCEDDLEANQNDEGGQGPFIQNSFRISHQDALPCSSQAGTVYTDCALDVKTASQLPIKVVSHPSGKSLPIEAERAAISDQLRGSQRSQGARTSEELAHSPVLSPELRTNDGVSPSETDREKLGDGQPTPKSRGPQHASTRRAGELALVPKVTEDDTGDPETKDRNPRKRSRSAYALCPRGGKSSRRLATEELAERPLVPGKNSIKEFVERAMAKDRLLSIEARKKKAKDAAEEGSDRLEVTAQALPPPSNSFAPQLELVDGRLVPQAQSLVVQAQPEQVHLVVKEYSNVVNNHSHSNRIRTANWTSEETEAFFCAVKTFGTNFELIAKLFPGRCRRMLANKWRRESKLNPEKCDLAFSGTGGSDGYQRIVEALREGEAAGEPADVADLGVAATQLFGTALSSPAAAVEVWDEEADELVSSPNPSRGRGSRGRGGRGRGRGRGRARGQSDGNDPTPREGDETAIASNNAQGSQEQGSVRLNWRKKKAPVKSMPAEVSDLPASPKRGGRSIANRARGAGRRGRGRPRKQAAAKVSDQETKASSGKSLGTSDASEGKGAQSHGQACEPGRRRRGRPRKQAVADISDEEAEAFAKDTPCASDFSGGE